MAATPTRARHKPVAAWITAVLTMIAAGWVLHKTFTAAAQEDSLPLWALLLAAIWAVGGLTICALAPRNNTTPPSRRFRTPLVISSLSLGFAALCFVGGWIMYLLPLTHDAVAENLSAAQSAFPLSVVSVALIAGAAEECFFRLGLANLTVGWMRWVLPNALYFLVTLASGNPVLALAAPLLGLTATAAREYTRTWYAPVIVHATWSLALVWLFPLTVTLWAAEG